MKGESYPGMLYISYCTSYDAQNGGCQTVLLSNIELDSFTELFNSLTKLMCKFITIRRLTSENAADDLDVKSDIFMWFAYERENHTRVTESTS